MLAFYVHVRGTRRKDEINTHPQTEGATTKRTAGSGDPGDQWTQRPSMKNNVSEQKYPVNEFRLQNMNSYGSIHTFFPRFLHQKPDGLRRSVHLKPVTPFCILIFIEVTPFCK